MVESSLTGVLTDAPGRPLDPARQPEQVAAVGQRRSRAAGLNGERVLKALFEPGCGGRQRLK
jgi:hypothetical protein